MHFEMGSKFVKDQLLTILRDNKTCRKSRQEKYLCDRQPKIPEMAQDCNSVMSRIATLEKLAKPRISGRKPDSTLILIS